MASWGLIWANAPTSAVTNAAGLGNAASAAWKAAASAPVPSSSPLMTAWKAVLPAAIRR